MLVQPSTLPTLVQPAALTTSLVQPSTLSFATDADLVVGYGVIAAACTPYVIGVVFPTFFDNLFPIYPENDVGRKAEIGWKVRYAALALALTTLAAAEVFVNPNKDIVGVLRDSYIVWAIFYTEATRKIRAEALDGIITKNRFGIQLWHSIVVIVLWAEVSQSPVAQWITETIKSIFSS